MAKRQFQQQTEDKNTDMPSMFGSHAEMINHELTEQISENAKEDVSLFKLLTNHNVEELGMTELVVLTDSYGDYLTVTRYLDSGLADVNRSRAFVALDATSITAGNFLERQKIVKSVLDNQA